jgi:hypothetical protein
LLIAAAAWSCSGDPPASPILPDASSGSSGSSSGALTGDDQTSGDDASPTSGSASGAADATTDDASSADDASIDTTSDATSEAGDLDAAAEASTDAGPHDAAPEASVTADAGDAGDASSSGPWVYLFNGGSSGTSFGGRTGADAMCANAAAKLDAGAPFAHVRAFLGVSDSDEIRDMPTNYGVPVDRPVGSVSGVEVASDWSALLGGTITHSLSNAGVLTSVVGWWYSGSNPDGSLATQPTLDGGTHPLTCVGWTSGNAFLDGEYGSAGVTNSQWISTAQATCGLGNYNLLCVGWN